MLDWLDLQTSVSTGFAGVVKRHMQRPETLFITDDQDRHFTYGDYWTLAGRMALALARLGVARGDRVALQADKSVEGVALFLACARLGAIFLPLNTGYTESEVQYFLEDAEPAIFIRRPEELLVKSGSGDFTDVEIGWNEPLALLYTSGTTGKSKGAILTHANLASNAVALVNAWQFTERDVLIHALPVYHTHGLFVAMNTVIFSGGSILFRTKFDADDVMALMPRATCMMGVPTFYTRLLSHPGMMREAVAHMRLFVSGSAPLLAETHRAFEQRTGHAILERYGMTETSMITSNPYLGTRCAGTVGFPLERVDVRIIDPRDGIGMIAVKGPNVFQGYWRQPEKTIAGFTPDGFFKTGDLGSFDMDGYLSISGRGKDLIISGGLNVYPKEVELAIDALPGVVESAVIGVPHPDFGEAVVAAVVIETTLEEEGMILALATGLAKFKIPKRIVKLDQLPRNAMGKVQKAVLRQQFAGLFSGLS
jgi:malonyl-CoA/methylmalonyl-CoA synthetase